MGNRVFLTTASIVGLLLILRYTKIDQEMLFYLSNVFLNAMQKNIQTITDKCEQSERNTLADTADNAQAIHTKLKSKLNIHNRELKVFFNFLAYYYNVNLSSADIECNITTLVKTMMRNSQQKKLPLSLKIEPNAISIQIGDDLQKNDVMKFLRT